MIGQVFGQYRIVDQLGAGGMGAVFRARDERLNRDVALKVLLEGTLANDLMRARFRDEALAVAALNHPNIGTVYNIETHGDLDLLVMEYIPGATLHQKVAAGPLPEADIRAIGAQIASALEESHAHGIIHRDLKPTNVIVTPRGIAKVVDFGLAEIAQPSVEHTAPQTRLPDGGGTLPYMAPEQLRGHEVTPRTDVYGLGVVLYEMATGRRPFAHSFVGALTEAVLREPPPSPRSLNSGISASLERIILRAIAKSPEDRWESASSLREALQGERQVPELARSVRTSRLFWAAVLFVAIAAAATVPLLLNRRQVSAPSVGAGVTSLVALPAQVFGSDTDQFLSDAIPNALSTQLTTVSNLETKLPPSSVDFDRLGRDVDKVARSYGVNGVIQSSVTVQGDRLTLDLKLVDATSRRVLWSQVYEGARQSFIDLIRGAANGVRTALRPDASPQAATRELGTNSEAELLMRSGLYHASQFGIRGLPADYERARIALERAHNLAPNRAEPAWQLARLSAAQVVTGVKPEDVAPLVRSWARKALDIDPNASSAWAALSEAEQVDPRGDERLMLEFALKATATGPNDAYAHTRLAVALQRASLTLGLEASRRASALEPLALNAPISEAIALASLGRHDEALARIDHALALEPDMPFGLLMKALTLVVADRVPAAAALLPQLGRMVDDRRLRPEWLQLVRDYVTFGGPPEPREPWTQARNRLSRLARGELPFPRWESATAEVAPLLVRHGDVTAAIDLLETRHNKRTIVTMDFFLFNPDLARLRGEPRFERLIETTRRGFAETITLLEQARARGEFPAYLENAYRMLVERTRS